MPKNRLTKTDFIEYLDCDKSLWLKKNKREAYPDEPISLYEKRIQEDGYKVEELTEKLFKNGIQVPSRNAIEATKETLKKGAGIYYQPEFLTPEGLLARVDILEKHEDGSFTILEVKSSTRVKPEHKKDACFQKYVMTQLGMEVKEVYVIHINKEYVLEGEEIDYEAYFVKANLTETVEEIFEETVGEIEEALAFINQAEIDESNCDCLYKTRSNHCRTFTYFNPNIPEHSIYELNRIRKSSIKELVDAGIMAIKDIPDSFRLNNLQEAQRESVITGKPVIDKAIIKQQLDSLQFPLHFIDYETYASAIPKLRGTRPHQHLVFQVSVHTMHESGKIDHFDYLADELEMPSKLLTALEKFTGWEGTFISWHASFENSRNEDMMKLLPEFKDYLQFVVDHTFDLEKIFTLALYVDARFKGSTSIKKVLPVLLPNLSYEDLEIQDGTAALETWERYAVLHQRNLNRRQTSKNLKDYCERDTYAMVEIYRELRKIVE